MARNNKTVTLLINRIMNINAKLAGMGGAEAAIFATTHPAAPVVTQLKNTTIQFAEVYRTEPAGKGARDLAQEIEGLLSVLVSMSVISEVTYTELADLLNELVPLGAQG